MQQTRSPVVVSLAEQQCDRNVGAPRASTVTPLLLVNVTLAFRMSPAFGVPRRIKVFSIAVMSWIVARNVTVAFPPVPEVNASMSPVYVERASS